MNELVEQIVERKPSKTEGPIKGLLVGVCVLSVLLFLIAPGPIMVFVVAAAIIFTVLIFRNYKVEYEYSFFNNELQIDKIIAKSSRKKGQSFDFGRLEVMAPVGDDSLKRFENNKYKVMNYSSNDPNERVFSAYLFCNNEMVNLLFEPNDDMLRCLNYLNPRKVLGI